MSADNSRREKEKEKEAEKKRKKDVPQNAGKETEYRKLTVV
jgi:hypothetical protein